MCWLSQVIVVVGGGRMGEVMYLVLYFIVDVVSTKTCREYKWKLAELCLL